MYASIPQFYEMLASTFSSRPQTSLLPGHRRSHERQKQPAQHVAPLPATPVARRPLAFYDQVAKRLAGAGRPA
jgi:hypothetical protein